MSTASVLMSPYKKSNLINCQATNKNSGKTLNFDCCHCWRKTWESFKPETSTLTNKKRSINHFNSFYLCFEFCLLWNYINLLTQEVEIKYLKWSCSIGDISSNYQKGALWQKSSKAKVKWLLWEEFLLKPLINVFYLKNVTFSIHFLAYKQSW